MLAFKLGGNVSLPPAPEVQRGALTPPQESASAATVKKGEALYQRYCGACHGDVAVSGGVLPDLRYSKMLLAGDQWQSIVIKGGLSSAGMISFSKELTRDDAEAIRSYVIFRAKQSIAESKAGKN
jgi:alcohol dehydrogenase (cytochrome c)/quinohemoprotein ethanol dehydrogenase